MAQKTCGAGSRFSRCRAEPVDTCQYCGRPFCAAHTYFAQDHEAVCTRKPCRVKKLDLDAHMVYRQRVAERNRAGLCGIEECGPHPALQCSMCRGQFCANHVSERSYPFRDGRVVINRPASVCQWCWKRRKIWRH
jgi:predicted nucleic acid binding AN1-type Zn finger protein